MRLSALAMTRICCVAVCIGRMWAAPVPGHAATTPGESRQDAIAPGSQPSVVETQWNLVELNGSAVHVSATEGQVYIYLQQDGDKLSGSDGCNRFFGSYDLRGASLEFHSVAQTMMACRGNFTDREAEFLDALKLISSYQISDDTLQLKVEDRVLARFHARKK